MGGGVANAARRVKTSVPLSASLMPDAEESFTRARPSGAWRTSRTPVYTRPVTFVLALPATPAFARIFFERIESPADVDPVARHVDTEGHPEESTP